MELVFGIREKTGEQERNLTGDRNAGALAEECQSHGPVAVVGDECAEPVEDLVVHEEQFSVVSTQFFTFQGSGSTENWEFR
jgi:hypothetical protein